MNIFIAILALSFLIIVHEFGHFIVAKMSGIKVLEFSLFMGPKLFGVQKGETLYSIKLIPLGGYVKMEGEEQESDDSRAYSKKPVLVRAAVIAAGPIMNLLMAIIMITIITSVSGYRTTEIGDILAGSPAEQAGLQIGDKIVSYGEKRVYHPMDVSLFTYGTKGKPVDIDIIRDGTKKTILVEPDIIPKEQYLLGFSPMSYYGTDSNIVANVDENSETYKAGLRKGDKIIELNNTKVSSNKEIGSFMSVNKDKPVQVKVLRNENEVVITIKPRINGQEQYIVGVGFTGGKSGIIESVKQSAIYSYSLSRNIFYSLVWLVTGNIGMDQMSGPVGIVTTIGDIVEASPTFADRILGLLNITGFISLNLGLFNLIPFPALDGSKLVLLAVEGIRRKAIPPEREAIISLVGLALLIMLMIYATYNDILRLFG